MDLKGFGNYLRWFRKSNNWTQMEVANMIDCSLPTISKIENGEEFIGYRLFNRLNEIFEGFGMVYDEVHMEKIFKFKQARSELMHAIKNGRLKDIEKKLDKFEKYMKEKERVNKESLDKYYDGQIRDWERIHYDSDDNIDKQYFVYAHLVCSRRSGMSLEQFLAQAIGIFELRRKIPDFNDIPNIKLSNIEYELFLVIGKTHMALGDDKTAEQIFRGLLNNKGYLESPKNKERFMEISSIMARMYFNRKDISSSFECLDFIFAKYFNEADTRIIYRAICLLAELCALNRDYVGAEIIDRFLQASRDLMLHILRKYRLKQTA